VYGGRIPNLSMSLDIPRAGGMRIVINPMLED